MAFSSYGYDDDDDEEWPHGNTERTEHAYSVENEYPRTIAGHEKVMQKCRLMEQEQQQAFKAVHFCEPLEPDTSMKECVAAINSLIRAVQADWAKWPSLRKSLHEELDEDLLWLRDLENSFETALGGSETAPEDLTQQWTAFTPLLEKAEKHHEAWKAYTGPDMVFKLIEMQRAITRLLSKQSIQTKIWYHMNASSFVQHLHRRKSSRLAVSDKQTKFVPGKGGDLPLEIATTLYEQCDLETCLALKQANSFWYRCFELCERSLELKVRARNPWMRPEGDLKTWGDCALVLLSRQRNLNWLAAYSPETARMTVSEKPVRPVVAMTLEYEWRVPEAFEALESHELGCVSAFCDKLHLTKDKKTASLDLRTNRVTEEPTNHIVEVSSDKTATVVRYKGLTLTFPGKEHFKSTDILTASVNDAYVQMTTATSVFVFPRNQGPLHCKKAYQHPVDKFPLGYRLADTHVTYIPADDGANFYYLLDFTSLSLKRVSGDTTSVPVAIYKGVLWWQTRCGRRLIPALIDVSDPDMLVYRHDWAIVVPQRVAARFTQVKKEGNTQFLTAKTAKETVLVDLETREISVLCSHNNCPNDKLLPGFSQDKFFVWSVGCKHRDMKSDVAFETLEREAKEVKKEVKKETGTA